MVTKQIYCIIGRRAARGLLLIFLAAVLFAAAGCSQSVAESYSDFLMNEDVLQRFEVCFADVVRGHAGSYAAGELRTLEKDLEYGYRSGDEDAARATELFQRAARTLAEAISEDPSQDSPLYKEARELFDEAWRISQAVTEGAYGD